MFFSSYNCKWVLKITWIFNECKHAWGKKTKRDTVSLVPSDDILRFSIISLNMTPLLSCLSLPHVHYVWDHTRVTLSKRKKGPSVVAGCFCCPVFQHDSEKQRALLREEKGDGISGRVYFLSSKAKIERKKKTRVDCSELLSSSWFSAIASFCVRWISFNPSVC